MIVKGDLKCRFQMMYVSLEGAAIDEDIVEEDDDEVVEIRPEDHILGGLK